MSHDQDNTLKKLRWQVNRARQDDYDAIGRQHWSMFDEANLQVHCRMCVDCRECRYVAYPRRFQTDSHIQEYVNYEQWQAQAANAANVQAFGIPQFGGGIPQLDQMYGGFGGYNGTRYQGGGYPMGHMNYAGSYAPAVMCDISSADSVASSPPSPDTPDQ